MESLARPAHRRKLSNANGVFSFPSKNAYDDVFAAGVPPASAAAVTAKTKFKAPVEVEDYGEIFGGGSRRGSSIPVLDLSALDDERKAGSEDRRSWSKKQVDYGKIFGGFRDEDIAVPYEELVAAKSEKCSSDKSAMNQSNGESPVRGPEDCRLSGKSKGHSSEASDQSLDGVKQVNMSYNKSSPRSKGGANGTTHIAKLQAVPGFTYFIDETARHQKTEGDRPGPKIRTEVQRTWSFSGNLQEENNGTKTDVPLPSKVSANLHEENNAKKTDVPLPNKLTGNLHEENNGKKTDVPLPNKLTSEGVMKGKRGYLCDGSRSKNKLFYSGEINLKSHSFKSSPSSTPPAKQNDSKGNPKRSKSSSFSFEANAFEKAGDYLTGSSDEEVDMNSAAFASAAALKKAIEQAQESIRLAKELMERKKDGFQSYSRPSAKGRNGKESRNESEANNSKENNKGAFVRYDNVLEEFTGRNRRVASHCDEVATNSELTENFSASRKVEVEKHKKDVKVQAKTMLLRNIENHRTAISASGQIESKNTVSGKEACDFGEMKITVGASECLKSVLEKTKAVEQDMVLGNPENRTNIHSKPQSGETIKVSVSSRIHNYGTHDDLKIEDIPTEDMRNSFGGRGECENNLPEGLHIIRGKLEPPRLEDDYRQKESPKLVEEKASQETIQEHMGTEFEGLHVKKNENGIGFGNSSNQGGGVLQEAACQLVEKDDRPIEVSGVSCQKAHVDSLEGEDDVRPDLIQAREDEMVVICASNAEENQTISNAKLKEEEVEEVDLEPIDARDGDISKMIMEEHEGEEAQRSSGETRSHVEANLEVPKEEFEGEKVQKRVKEDYVTEAHEDLWMEAGKHTEDQKVEVIKEAGEAEGTHFGADNCSKNHEAACERKTELEVQEADRFKVSDENVKTSLDAAENHKGACNTAAEADEALNQCERDTEKAEARVNETSKLEREVFEAAHCVQSAYQEHIIPGDMQSDSGTVNSDGNGANVHHNEINHAHKFLKGNTFETADLVQGAEKGNDSSIKMEAPEAHPCDENAACTASSVNCSEKGLEENVKEGLSFNPEIGCGLVQNSIKISKNIQEVNLSYDKEGKTNDVDLVIKQTNTVHDSEEAKSIPSVGQSTTYQVPMETYKEMKRVQNMQHAEEYLSKTGATDLKEMGETKQNGVKEKDDSRKTEENKKERERNTDRIAVERVIREARERAFAEARERAERAAVERAAAEVRQRVMTEAREKLEKVTTGTKLANKTSIEAKLRAERAAVERATAEARQRAFEKARSLKSTAEARVQVEKSSGASRENGLKHSLSTSDLERMEGSESAQRRKAILERHNRIMERAAKALEEKNTRDLLAQKEQAERNRLAEYLDADIKRWASGKEGNLRALLSTLQYILGPDSGWQPISLTEIITTVAVKKAYRKATLYVHPDKLQQRGATIQQKYICEKVFDLLKAAWNRFNSEER